MTKLGRIGGFLKRSDISLSDLDIISYYLGITKLPCLINNPLREDKNPSLSVFLNRNYRVGFKDFATGEYYTTIEFLIQLWNVPRQEVYKILGGNNTPQKLSKKTKLKKPKLSHLTDLKVKVRKWQEYDFEYWKSYGIDKEYLIKFNVYPISHILLEYNDATITSVAHKYSYVYVEGKDDKVSLKVYQPFAERANKFKNNHNNSVWDLWNSLPDSADMLIITSSRKDAMCLWSNLNIPSICMQSESVTPNPKVIEELKSRFKDIYILYDNDYDNPQNPGQSYAQKIAKQFNLINIFIPDDYKSKDPSDLYKNHGKKTFTQVIQSLLNPKDNA